MGAIDADNLESIKFHSLPYTHITPTDADAESYKRGWNDAIDAIIENEPTIEPERTGRWILVNDNNGQHAVCEFCGEWKYHQKQKFCGECGARMEMDHDS